MSSESGPISKGIVTTGSLITRDGVFMKGHGTFVENGEIYASITGTVERINKLVSVTSLRQRYSGEIGDIVVGRISRVGLKRWLVNVNGRQDARRKSASDELQMRKFFKEGDVVFAEVQSVFVDGALSLHTRSLDYGKLRNGVVCYVSPALVVRSRSHLISLHCGVDVVLGVNGCIHIGKHRVFSHLQVDSDNDEAYLKDEQSSLESNTKAGNSSTLPNNDYSDIYSDVNDDIDISTRTNISRVHNCIVILDRLFIRLNSTSINTAYEQSLQYFVPELLKQDVANEIAESRDNKNSAMTFKLLVNSVAYGILSRTDDLSAQRYTIE
ncbi:hypothetical protein BB560_001837 [Smittium megazygosporum]|uniref:Uncharacterized protein n=1 Tax=Smittium megazygosporum TaxID=133381 RepID=A0A2T9ZGH8_9FUNG|nr:hypothetical protein BB560_001837 [Smittium megazygosporum]